jgi:hypothetical protein
MVIAAKWLTEHQENEIWLFLLIPMLYVVACQREQTMYFRVIAAVPDSLGDRRAL